MTDQASLLRVQKLTQKLQRALEEYRPSKGRTRSDPGVLGDPYEWERVRRSAAPSPEVFLTEESEQLEKGLTGAVRTPSQAFLHNFPSINKMRGPYSHPLQPRASPRIAAQYRVSP